jgi:iron complex outermembrane receptor protein
LSKRDGKSAANWRLPNGNNTVRGLWPNGFLPLILTDIWDGSGTVGVRGSALGWQWDSRRCTGGTRCATRSTRATTPRWGSQSPRRFDAGGLAFGQSTTTLDVARDLRVAGSLPLRLAAARSSAMISTGSTPATRRRGSTPAADPRRARTRTAGRRARRRGAQGLSGVPPGRRADVSRSNIALYADAESDLTKRLLVGLAGRYEDYSDFGSTATGKLTTRVAVVPQLALRGAVNTGFRAPSLGQSFFSSTATNLVAGQFLEIRTLPVNTAGARALGAEPLKPEKSVDLSAGVVVEPTRNLSLTVDFYNIRSPTGSSSPRTSSATRSATGSRAIGLQGVTGARYFTNAIDTRTRGVDVIANYGLTLPDQGVLRLTGAYNNTRTRVTRVKATPAELTGFDEQLFGRAERGRIEEASRGTTSWARRTTTGGGSAWCCGASASGASPTGRRGSPRTSRRTRRSARSG